MVTEIANHRATRPDLAIRYSQRYLHCLIVPRVSVNLTQTAWLMISGGKVASIQRFHEPIVADRR